jgi:MarR family transcriptional regulator, lower aerobic nicotinate degradation pathway regulator
MQAGRLALEWTAEALEPFQLSLPEFAVMSVVHRLGPVAQNVIANRLGISEVTVSGIASRLVGEGLAERRVHVFDIRRRLLTLTVAGGELLAEASDELSGVEALCLEHMTEELRQRLAELPPPDLNPVEEALLLRWD